MTKLDLHTLGVQIIIVFDSSMSTSNPNSNKNIWKLRMS